MTAVKRVTVGSDRSSIFDRLMAKLLGNAEHEGSPGGGSEFLMDG